MNFFQLPKIELHLHLDCSLSYQVVQQLAPNISLEEFQNGFIAPPKCHDLADYLTRANKHIELMQTKEALRLVTLDLFDQLKHDRVIYAEIRFAPFLHLQQGLKPEEVIETVDAATTEAIEKTGVKAGLLLCTLRHYSEEESLATVKLVEQFQGTNVVGFDIAADEAGFPIDNHINAFAYAKEKGLNITAHAGEAKGAESVWETLKYFNPSRIGHGVRSIEDPKLLDYLKQHNIHLEVCPTSNVQTNVTKDFATHPIDELQKKGLSVGINTDARTISNVTLNQEYQSLHESFGWQIAHFKQCNLDALAHSFAYDVIKEQLRIQLLEAYDKIIS